MANQMNSLQVETVAIAIPLPLRELYTFAVPQDLQGIIARGQRVLIPFQGRRLIGYVVRLDPPPAGDFKLKDVESIADSDAPTFNAEMLDFLMWVADYYQAPLGEVLRGAHPSGTNAKSVPAVRLVETTHPALPGLYPDKLTQCIAELHAQGGVMPISELSITPSKSDLRQWIDLGIIQKTACLQSPRVVEKFEKEWRSVHAPPSAPRGRGGRVLKRDRLHAFIHRAGQIRHSELREHDAYSAHGLKQLNDSKAITARDVPKTVKLFSTAKPLPDKPPRLNAEQAHAVETITAQTGFCGFLLRGITGSGKTEVYLRAIAHVLDAGKGALVLVPEIALTPQLVTRFRARLGDGLAVLHSGMNDQQRLAHWKRLKEGQVRLAIGARSAVFAPVENLGIIVVDEEHDGSFKQSEGVRYHGRDLAILRAFKAKCPIVLGSATPSLESLHNVTLGKLVRLDLAHRASGGALPEVELVDLRVDRKLKDAPISERIIKAIQTTLEKREQTIVFLNRRGFSTFALCEACGHVVECEQCSISMTWHKTKKRLACHYCNAARPLPNRCPKCDQDALTTLGSGTEKVEETLNRLFPDARIARLDRDTASGPGLQNILSGMRNQEIDILVGTQMVTKGHDFPEVTLVCVLDADAGLKLPDFRSAERTVQLLAQVSGRAGRAKKPGRVLIQSYQPDHHALQALKTHEHESFIKREAGHRELFGYPPYAHAVTIRVEGRSPQEVRRYIKTFTERVGPLLNAKAGGRIRGPAPAIIERIRGKSRWAVLITHTDRSLLRSAIFQVQNALTPPNSIKLIIDIDPIDLM